MISLQNRLRAFYTGLTSLGIPCTHFYAASAQKPPYIVWYEDSEDNSLQLDNHKARQALSGYVDFFTKTEFDSNFDVIQEYLDNVEGLSWSWESSQYGDPTQGDTNLYHHTWSWRLR